MDEKVLTCAKEVSLVHKEKAKHAVLCFPWLHRISWGAYASC